VERLTDKPRLEPDERFGPQPARGDQMSLYEAGYRDGWANCQKLLADRISQKVWRQQ